MKSISNTGKKKKIVRRRKANPNNPYHIQGDILRNLRIEAGYSNAEDVAPLIGPVGYSVQEYRAWESGRRRPNEYALGHLAKFFHVSKYYLLGEMGEYKTIGEQEICEMTGLDQEVVRKLIREKSYYDRLGYEAVPAIDSKGFKSMDLINSLIISEEYESMMYCFMRLCESNLRKKLLEQNVKLSPFDEYSEIDYVVDRDKEGKLMFIREDTNEKIRMDQDITGRIAFDTNNLRTSFDNYLKKAVSVFVDDKLILECLEKAKKSPSAIRNKDIETEARRTGRLFDEADWRNNWRKQK